MKIKINEIRCFKISTGLSVKEEIFSEESKSTKTKNMSKIIIDGVNLIQKYREDSEKRFNELSKSKSDKPYELKSNWGDYTIEKDGKNGYYAKRDGAMIASWGKPECLIQFIMRDIIGRIEKTYSLEDAKLTFKKIYAIIVKKGVLS